MTDGNKISTIAALLWRRADFSDNVGASIAHNLCAAGLVQEMGEPAGVDDVASLLLAFTIATEAAGTAERVRRVGSWQIHGFFQYRNGVIVGRHELGAYEQGAISADGCLSLFDGNVIESLRNLVGAIAEDPHGRVAQRLTGIMLTVPFFKRESERQSFAVSFDLGEGSYALVEFAPQHAHEWLPVPSRCYQLGMSGATVRDLAGEVARAPLEPFRDGELRWLRA